MKPHIVFIESNLTNGLSVLPDLKKTLGAELSFITSDLNSYLSLNKDAAEFLKACHVVIEIPDTGSVEAIWPHLLELHQNHPIDVLYTFYDLHVPIVSELARRLGLRGLSPAAALICRDKALTRKVCAAAGIIQPKSVLALSLAEAIAAADELGYPVIVKPSDGSASINTVRANDELEVRKGYENIQAHLDYGTSIKATRKILIEELVEGPLVSVECVTTDGFHQVLGITDRKLGGEPYFVELGGSFPVEIPEHEALAKATQAALDAVGFDFGASHVEWILSRKGPVLIEINPRLAGAVMADLINATLNRNIMVDLIRQALGEKINFIPKAIGVGTIAAITAKVAGTITAIKHSPVASDSRVIKYQFSKKLGDRVQLVQNNRDRLGYVVTLGKTATESMELASRIQCGLVLEIEPAIGPV